MKDRKRTDVTDKDDKIVISAEDNVSDVKQFEKEVKESFHEFRVEATIPKLRVREAPSIDAEEIDAISKGQSVTIVKVKGDWGKTKFGDGWVNLKYTRRV